MAVAHGWAASGKCPQHVTKLCPAWSKQRRQVSTNPDTSSYQVLLLPSQHLLSCKVRRLRSSACRATEFLMVRKCPRQIAWLARSDTKATKKWFRLMLLTGRPGGNLSDHGLPVYRLPRSMQRHRPSQSGQNETPYLQRNRFLQTELRSIVSAVTVSTGSLRYCLTPA